MDADDRGAQDGLSAPQVYDLGPSLEPGEHILTVMVNNAKVPPVGPAHALDERTQTNWNGIIGRLELRASPPVRIDDVQVYPDVSKRTARVRVLIGNSAARPAAAALTIRAQVSPAGKLEPVTAARIIPPHFEITQS